MKTWYVYGHFTKDTNELFYIGVGTGSRINDKSGRNTYWDRIVTKHGYEAYIILDGYTDRDEAVKEEIRLQHINKPRACLVYGDTQLQEISEETRSNMSKAQKGNTNPLGHKRSEEYKSNMSRIKKNSKATKDQLIILNKSKCMPVINCRGHIFESKAEAAKVVGLKCISGISRSIKDINKSAGKYEDGSSIKWSYHERT